jgi:transcriptional regulator with XRE-family HTH domain
MPRREVPDPTCLKLGGRLRKVRKQRGLSISQFAEESEQSKGHVCSIEQGLVNVTVGTIVKMAKALKTTPMYLLCAVGNSDLEKAVEALHALPEETQRELAAKVAREAQRELGATLARTPPEASAVRDRSRDAVDALETLDSER